MKMQSRCHCASTEFGDKPPYIFENSMLLKTLMLGWMGAGGEGDDRGWDGWMASLTRWTWVWVTSGSWWWTGRSGVLRFMGSQRVWHDWMTELNWTERTWKDRKEFQNPRKHKHWKLCLWKKNHPERLKKAKRNLGGKTIKKWFCSIPKNNFLEICPFLHTRKRDKEQTHWKRTSHWKRLRAGGEGGNREWDNWMASRTQWDMSLSKFWEIVKDRESWSAAVRGVAKRQTGWSGRTTATEVAQQCWLSGWD